MLSCCQTASRLRNGKNCCSLKITEGGISPRVSASPGQQNEFSHPVIPNIRDIRGAESNGDRGVTLGSHVPRFTMREKSSFANTANGCNVTLRARELFLLVNLHFFFPVASRLSLILPSPPFFLLLLFSFLFISLDQRARWKISGRYSFLQGNRRGPVIEFI